MHNLSENKEDVLKEKQKSCVKKNKDNIPRGLNKVKVFYRKKHSYDKAEKFYSPFQSNGWLVGGKSKMKNWQAAVRNWMLNVKKYNQNNNQLQPQHLQITKKKIMKNHSNVKIPFKSKTITK